MISQFQILLRFYMTSEKVMKIKLAMVIDKRFEPHLFNLYILVTISFFHEIQAPWKKGKKKFSPETISCRDNYMKYKTFLYPIF